MSGNRYTDVLKRVVQGPVVFNEFKPRNVPGFPSNIAQVFGCSADQTDNLLKAVDILEADHHYHVHRKPVGDPQQGSKGKEYPQKYEVTISPA